MGSPCGPGEGLPEWCLGGEGSWEGGVALIPQVLLRLGGDQREGLWKRKGFLGRLVWRLSRVRSALAFTRHEPFKSEHPRRLLLSVPKSTGAVGAPVQEERNV